MKNYILFFLSFILLTGFSTDRAKPSVCVSADKMNIFYVGIDNPISIEVKNVSQNEIKVACINCTISKKTSHHYLVRVSNVGAHAKVVINHKEQLLKEVEFAVKRIPNPTPILAAKRTLNNQYTVEEFQEVVGVVMLLENLDYDAVCSTQGFYLTRITKDGVRRTFANKRGSFMGNARNAVEDAASGDIYIFDRLKSKCSGDKSIRSHRTAIVAYIK